MQVHRVDKDNKADLLAKAGIGRPLYPSWRTESEVNSSEVDDFRLHGKLFDYLSREFIAHFDPTMTGKLCYLIHTNG